MSDPRHWAHLLTGGITDMVARLAADDRETKDMVVLTAMLVLCTPSIVAALAAREKNASAEEREPLVTGGRER